MNADPEAVGPRRRRDAVEWFVRRAGVARFSTFAAAAGMALAGLVGARQGLALCCLAGALLATIGAAAARHRALFDGRRQSRAGSSLLVLGILATGLFSGYLLGGMRASALTESDLQQYVGQRVEAELVVTGSVRSSSGWLSAAAVVRGLTTVGGRQTGGPAAGDGVVGERVLLEIEPPDGADPGPATALSQGAIVTFTGRVQAPRGASQSGYDQARQLLHQGVKVVLRAGTIDSVAITGRRGGVAGWFDRLRVAAREHMSLGPDDRIDEVLQGVVVGDTVGIDDGWLEAFRRAGTAHMLSVSGLHVASLAAIMIGLARLLRAPRWVGFLLAAAAAVLLVPFVGASPPVLRSAVMIVVVLLGRWMGRGRDQWQVLALAAVAVLGLNPFAVFDVGFQLSFAAFVGMLLLVGPLQRSLRRLPAFIGSNVAVSLAASAGTAPVALVVFGKTSLVAPLANLLVVPTLPVVTGLGMASVFLGFVWTGLSTALDTLAAIPLMWTVLVSRLMSLAPVLNTGDLGRVAAALVAGATVLPVAWALLGRAVSLPFGLRGRPFGGAIRWVRARRPRSRRLALMAATIVVCAGLAVGAAAYPVVARSAEGLRIALGGRGWPKEVELRVLDIGQGNAVLLRTPQRQAALFDGGPAGCDLAGQLHALGVDELDLVVISHPHADHFAGLLESLEQVEVKTLVDCVRLLPSPAESGRARASPSRASIPSEAGDYLELRRRVAEEGGAYALVSTGGSLRLGDVTVSFYAPSDPLVLYEGASPWGAGRAAPAGDELNAASLVAVVTAGGVDVLLPGDAESQVLQRYHLPSTEVLVVPHHGSRGALTSRLLSEWGTVAAVISVGRENNFGHPDEGTLGLLLDSVGYVMRTDDAGWVCCSVKGDSMSFSVEHAPVSVIERAAQR